MSGTIYLFANNAKSQLAANIGPSATTITLASGTGALFPSPTPPQIFALTLNDLATQSVYEVCNCTSRSGDVLTVTRGAEGTTALSWVVGDFAWNGPTMAQQNNLIQLPHMADSTITPNFLTTKVTGNLTVTVDSSLQRDVVVGRNLVVNGTAAFPVFASFGVTGQFYAQDNSGAQLLNFGPSSYLQFTPGSGFTLTTPLHVQINAGGNVNFGTPLLEVDGGVIRIGTGAYGSGDLNRAVILSDFTASSSPSTWYSRLPNGYVIQGFQGVLPTGWNDAFPFPVGMSAAVEIVVGEQNSNGWAISAYSPTIWGSTNLIGSGVLISCLKQSSAGSPNFIPAAGASFRALVVGVA